jgi:hypothetical protein
MLYIIMDLTQFERMKSELEQRIYEENKTAGTYLRLTIDITASKQETRDTTNNAREKIKEQG